MILNVSSRTDIVAFYTNWFMERYHEGYVDVRNPFYPNQISRIKFENVDAILFCTKNPIPIINRIEEIKHPILFHVTLTPYKKDIEPNLPKKREIIDAIKKISNIIGKDNIYLRYDPILLNDYYNIDYHIEAFEKICSLLNGYVTNIIVSFIDDYKNVRNNIKVLKLNDFTMDDYKEIGINFSKIAKKYNMTIQTCCEKNNLNEYGFIINDCVSKESAFKLTGKTFKKWKSRNCNCIEMADIGCYNTCMHFCKYCYANYDERKVISNYKKHITNSSLLIGKIENNDLIKERIK